MPRLSDDIGSNQNSYRVGVKGGGQRTIEAWNGFLQRFIFNPTANRNIIVPDKSGTISLFQDGDALAASQAVWGGFPLTALANNTTLTQAQSGYMLPINGGTINLPADADWALGTDFVFWPIGTNPTTIAWGTNTLSYYEGNSSSIVLGGTPGTMFVVKKKGAGSADAFGSAINLNGLADVTIASPLLEHTLKHNGTQWVNDYDTWSVFEPKRRFVVAPTNAATQSVIGTSATNLGTITTGSRTTTNLLSRIFRNVFTSAATAGALTGQRHNAPLCSREGGFKIQYDFFLVTTQSGQRAFFGIGDPTTAPTNIDPLSSTASGLIGMACNANTGNWQFIYKIAGSAPIVADMGAGFPIDIATRYRLRFWANPNALGINYEITNMISNQIFQGVVSGANIPTLTTYLCPYFWMTNNATAALVAFAIGETRGEYA